MMRRVILTFLSVAVLAAVLGSSASAATFPGCGKNHPPTAIFEFRCTKPVIHVRANPACQAPGAYTLPPIHIKANGGLRKVVIKLGGKTVKTFHYDRKGQHGSLRGPRFKTIRNVTIKSHALKHGRHTVSVTVYDWKGKHAHTSFPIAICKPPPPPFTG
jgi:hypothetical protein